MALSQRGRADQVAEQRGHGLADLTRRRRRRERGGAGHAERGVVRVLATAVRAGQHVRSVGCGSDRGYSPHAAPRSLEPAVSRPVSGFSDPGKGPKSARRREAGRRSTSGGALVPHYLPYRSTDCAPRRRHTVHVVVDHGVSDGGGRKVASSARAHPVATTSPLRS